MPRTAVLASLLSVAVALAVAGCDRLEAALDGPVPCVGRFRAERCEAMADSVAIDLGVDRHAIASLTVLPDQASEEMTLGTRPVRLAVTLADGTTRSAEIHCPGVSGGFVPACMDDPALRVASPTVEGYRDIPCGADNACATPLPPIDPDARAASAEIRVPRLDISVDAVGRLEIPVGEGSLPNGILTQADFRFVDDWPSDLSIVDAVVYLDVRSLEDDGRPFDNYYERGWREGVERIEAVLVFEVKRFEPGAVLSVGDLVVR